MNHGWEYKRLGELGTIITGTTPNTSVESYYNSADIMFVKPGDMDDNRLNNLHRTETYISKQAYNEVCRKLPKGSILVTCIGIIGKVAILDDYATCNQQINAIIPHNNLINKYLGYAILSIKDTLQSRKNGPIVPIINKTQFSTFKVPAPPINLQKQIVSELDIINELIEIKRSQLADLDVLAQSLFYEMFGVPFLNPMGWDIKAFGDLTDSINYGTSLPAAEGGQYPYLRMNNLTDNGYLDPSNLKYINIPDEDVDKCLVKDGDILFNRTNSREKVGKTALYNREDNMVIAGYIIRVRANRNRLNPVFAVRYMNMPELKNHLRKICRGAVNQANINSKEMAAIPLLVPPIELQNQFATKIKMIEEQKKCIDSSLTDLQTLLASRMDYWFNDI